MVYVAFENQSQKSLSQLIDQLKEAGNMEATALSALQDAVGAYKKCNPGPEYWEGFLAQILALFPFEVVKKQAEDVEVESELAETRLEAGRQIEDLTENIANLERELAEVRKEKTDWKTEFEKVQAQSYTYGNKMRCTLSEKEKELAEVRAERNELRKQLAEWESKGNELANGLIESSVGDRQSWEEEKALIIQGFEERVQFFSAEIDRYRKLEENWGARFANLTEELREALLAKDSLEAKVQELENREPADIIYERVEAKVKEKSDLYAEFIKLSETAGYLKVRESGEILAAYVGTNNQKNENGRILGKSILKDWQSHFQILYSKSGSEIRKAKRLETDWELKLTGLPIERIQALGTYDYTQPPQRPQQKPETKPEIELVKVPEFDPLCPEYKVVVSGEEYGRVWKIPGKLPSEWKHNLFGPQSRPFKSPEEAAKELVAIEREADKEAEDDSGTPDF